MVDIELLLSKIDILEYISQYGDFIEKNGGNWCCSPLNPNDTDPSFEVNTELQRFYDFSTEKYGDVLQFVKEYNNCDTSEAVDMLLKYAGLSEDEIEQYKPIGIVEFLKKYERRFKKVKETNYKILNSNYMDRYNFDESKFSSWVQEGIPIDIIRKYGISYDKLNNAIVIPMYDNNGNIVNISNRTLYSDFRNRKIPKYIYSFGWNGGGIDILWGYSFKKDIIKESKKIIIVEGVKSVLKLEAFGYDNVVAILTSHLNTLQMQQLIQSNVKEFIFALDMNVNIRNDSNIMLLRRYGKLSFLRDYRKRLGEKDSPCDGGKELFDELYNGRYVIN